MRRIRQIGRACLVSALLLASPMAPDARGAEQRLDERLFLVRDRPGTPLQFQMIVGAGCMDEPRGDCRGLAHYLEHLVLNGRNPEHTDIAGRFFADGYSNGWTNQRATAFVHSAPWREDRGRADLEKLFGFYAARLKDFHVSEADALRERNVVRQEHDWRVGGRPVARFARMIDRALLPDHPAGQWTIGTRDSIEALTLAEARAFHRAWYVPNNVHFVVKGDVDGAMLKEIADKTLANLERRPLPPRASAREPGLAMGREEFREIDDSVRSPAVYYRKLIRIEPGEQLSSRAARTLVTSFLTSRLPGSPHEALVDKTRLAASQPSIEIRRVGPRSFVLMIAATTSPGATPEALLTAIEDTANTLATSSIPAETLTRLKQRFADATESAGQDPSRVYSRLVSWLAGRGRYEDLAQWPAQVAAVSPEDAAAVLRSFARSGRVVTGIIGPPPGEAAR